MNDLYTRVFDQSCFDINKEVLEKFELLTDEDFKQKTHLFNGRYENIYLEVNKILELKTIVNAARENAASILNIKKEKLAFGFWLNAMGAGDVTTAHTHDDDDELLSCVYYIKAPENSGDLIITANNNQTIIKPSEGSFIFSHPIHCTRFQKTKVDNLVYLSHLILA